MITGRKLALLLVLFLVPSSTAARSKDHSRDLSSYVLIVANNKSLDQGVRPLRFADDDGARYWELFSRFTPEVTLLTVMDPDTARIHPDAAKRARVPWMRNLRAAVRRITRSVKRANAAGKLTSFTFVYVGHGNVAKDGEGYVNLQDVKLKRRDLFNEVIDTIPARSAHLIIDACKSFFLVSRGPGDWRDDRSGRTYGDEVKAFLARSTLGAHPNVGAILSTSGDEDVHEWSAFRAGVFSHQLRSALSGAADINGDGRVEYSEVGAFIAAANRRVVHQRARIRAFVHPPPANRQAALLDLRGARSGPRLELGVEDRGKFSVEDDRGVRQIDLNKAPGLRVRLALEGGRKYFVRHGGRETIVPRGRFGVVRLRSLDHGPASSDPRGSVDMAYRNNLFAVRLSRSFYEGYLATTDLPSVQFSTTGEEEEPEELADLGLSLDLSYAISPVVLDALDGVQHTISLGASKDLFGPLYLSLRAELGVSSHDESGLEYTMLRAALVGGVGLRWRVRSWLALALEANGGYQALVQTEQDNFDPTSAKFGTQLVVSFRPWRRLSQLGLLLRAGVFGHAVTETRLATDGTEVVTEKVNALPEIAVGLSWGF